MRQKIYKTNWEFESSCFEAINESYTYLKNLFEDSPLNEEFKIEKWYDLTCHLAKLRIIHVTRFRFYSWFVGFVAKHLVKNYRC